jgi:hypothetical protein
MSFPGITPKPLPLVGGRGTALTDLVPAGALVCGGLNGHGGAQP